jgi:hypothetical protein
MKRFLINTLNIIIGFCINLRARLQTESGISLVLDIRKAHTKCVCGASNGNFGSNIEEHRARCRYIGPANQMRLMRPNYSKFLEEDDTRCLPMLRAQAELKEFKKHK